MTERFKMINTADVVVTIGRTRVVLIKRAKEPFLDKDALVGGHFDETDTSSAHTGARELEEEIGLVVAEEDLELLCMLDAPDRDPRPDGRRVSTVWHVDFPDESVLKGCKPASDAKEIVIRDLASIREEDMAFDHYLAIKAVRRKLGLS